MNNSIKKLLAVLVALTLVFAMFTGMTASADEATMKYPTLPEGIEIIEGEVYSFREVLESVTLGLDHTALDEVYFDGYQWNVTHRQNFTDGPWGIRENWYARESTWEGFNCICVNQSTKEQDSEIWKNHEMMIEWNETDDNIYWSLQPLWSCSSNTWINFVAPHTGKIVLFEEFGNQITACSAEAPFWSFQQDLNRPWKITVEKNDVKIWPMEEDCAVLDKDNRSIAFPSLGKIGVMPVNEGDIISIRIDVAGEFESGAGYDYEGIKIAGNTTATFNPVVAYTEIEEPVPEVEDTFDDVDDLEDETKEPSESVGVVDSISNLFGVSAAIAIVLLVVFILGGLLIVAAIVVVIIVLIVKKKKKKANDVEPVAEEPTETSNEETQE